VPTLTRRRCVPHITDYRITLFVGVAIMALTFFAFRFIEARFNRRAHQGEDGGQE
jgi:hypothetical protein